ncbi:alpha/beta fold hydrolase [Rossellomorea marisflavi]|uniref:alpha/beta fold hydrolase n=1 Tax=Rossellomorea marisflavi TaxID=189381 RepID=UPI0028530087|nr:alpha/beta fold hydrolase [Rossellomorea marisflavi]MDR4938541.1 alpha/beta fold hydrolase [Rossellomorea marisflavi]
MFKENGEYQVTINGISHWVKVEGIERATMPMVVIHGGPGGNHYVFERTAGPMIAKERTIIYYEQRGCGRTDKPEDGGAYRIADLVEDFKGLHLLLGWEEVDLLGYSFGAELALEIAYTIPNTVNSLVLSAPSMMQSPLQKLVQIAGFASVGAKGIDSGATIEETYQALWDHADTAMVDKLLFQDSSLAAMNRKWWEESGLFNTGLMMRALENDISRPSLEERLSDIPHSTLILVGAFDRNTGIPVASLIHDRLQQSALTILSKSAHFPDIEEPEVFTRYVCSFLR